ncbi:peroxidase-related enzyme [Flavitalea sp. BT771]|uniref:carboxymuconolactone decarboxylase family protein n=1 Tax=Flavitalea sp. BT771 TaxID=3063329 RepID=UPI0026E436E4|nr:peroxidase-related enzyme [Flavitalea sp. BT771]MDO6430992.1 peroxidase-related enzyme [Flavitalea sp. BT771]MDV6219899.1 peroxidase-related enzyme [Flavitalea sp. BT771]
MPHIDLNNDLPGIRGLLAFRPEVAGPMGELANILLRDTDGLSPVDREFIATHVSWLNDCFYCHHSHGAIACHYLGGEMDLVDQVRNDYLHAPISEKLKALLTIAGKVQQAGKAVLPEDVENARRHGATDRDIHDTVLIAAAFCMFNRYVDGLAATTPTDLSTYGPRARQVAEKGYGNHIISEKQPAA